MRLVVAELRVEWRLWIAAAVALTAAGVVVSLDAALFATAASVGGDRGRDLSSIVGSITLFNGLTAAVVVSSVTTLCVALQRKQHALWQLIGARPAQVATIVIAQIVLLSTVAGILGALLAIPLVGPLWSFLAPTLSSIVGSSIVPIYPPGAAGWAIGILVAVAVMGALRGALRAARVRPIEALREQEDRVKRMSWGRWVLACLCAALIIPALVAVTLSPLEESAAAVPMVGPLTVAVVSILSPLMLPPLVRVWTAIVPPALSASWHLARANALHKLSVTTSVITPVLTAAALVGGLFSAFATLSNAMFASTGNRPESGADLNATLVILGGPVLLAALGAALTIVMSGRARDRDLALLRVAGGTPRLGLLAAGLEAVIYATTATLAAVVVVVAQSLLMSTLLSVRTPGTAPGLDLGAMLAICAVGLALLLVASLLPSAAAMRRSPTRALASA